MMVRNVSARIAEWGGLEVENFREGRLCAWCVRNKSRNIVGVDYLETQMEGSGGHHAIHQLH